MSVGVPSTRTVGGPESPRLSTGLRMVMERWEHWRNEPRDRAAVSRTNRDCAFVVTAWSGSEPWGSSAATSPRIV